MKRTVIVPTAAALVAALMLMAGCRRGEAPTGSPDTSARGASAPDMTASMPAPRASGG